MTRITLSSLIVISIMFSSVSPGQCQSGISDISTKSKIPKQIWVSEEILCQIDQNEDWIKQLDFAPGNGDVGTTIQPYLLTDWVLPDPLCDELPLPEPVVLNVIVNTEGWVERVGVISGQGLEYTKDLASTIISWNFKPGTYEGKPVCFCIEYSANPNPKTIKCNPSPKSTKDSDVAFRYEKPQQTPKTE